MDGVEKAARESVRELQKQMLQAKPDMPRHQRRALALQLVAEALRNLKHG